MRRAVVMTSMDDEDFVVPIREAAELLGISLSSLARLYAADKGPARRKLLLACPEQRQWQVRYSRAGLARWLATYPGSCDIQPASGHTEAPCDQGPEERNGQ